ncbi:MAG: hypothetical protein EOP86_15375 [Verrucomicrobiaceae bacterium]|nr:MAG: hypothetical protein EOP86_15375 [Verrucomicrobiaceae bacterium]
METVTAEDWARGNAYVGKLMGVTTQGARKARNRLAAPPKPPAEPQCPVPPGLQPGDSPTVVVRRHGVCVPTATKWLQSVGRSLAPVGRPRTSLRRRRCG